MKTTNLRPADSHFDILTLLSSKEINIKERREDVCRYKPHKVLTNFKSEIANPFIF